MYCASFQKLKPRKCGVSRCLIVVFLGRPNLRKAALRALTEMWRKLLALLRVVDLFPPLAEKSCIFLPPPRAVLMKSYGLKLHAIALTLFRTTEKCTTHTQGTKERAIPDSESEWDWLILGTDGSMMMIHIRVCAPAFLIRKHPGLLLHGPPPS